MKRLSKFIVFSSAFICLATVYAQSPRDELKQLVTQLQNNPSDTALREKIIKLAKTAKLAPAIPEEVERSMARGAAAFKGAKNANDYKDAVREFEQASLAAPWSGDIYYNLGLAQDKAGDHASAVRNLKLALLASPNSREIKTLLYEVEYRAEKSVSRSEERQSKLNELLNQITGFYGLAVRGQIPRMKSGRPVAKWKVEVGANSHIRIVKSSTISAYISDGREVEELNYTEEFDVVVEGNQLRGRYGTHGDYGVREGYRCSYDANDVTGQILDQGRKIVLSWTNGCDQSRSNLELIKL